MKPDGWMSEVKIWCPLGYSLTPGERRRVAEKAAADGWDTIRYDEHSNLLLVLGTADLVAMLSANHWVIADFKSIGSFGWTKLDTEGTSVAYQVQLAHYGAGLMHRDPNITRVDCHLIYEAQDSDGRKGLRAGTLRAVEVSMPDANFHYMKAQVRADAVLLAYIHDELETVKPTHEPDSRGALPWQCNYCPQGPLTGGCFPGNVVDSRRDGELIPRYKISQEG